MSCKYVFVHFHTFLIRRPLPPAELLWFFTSDYWTNKLNPDFPGHHYRFSLWLASERMNLISQYFLQVICKVAHKMMDVPVTFVA